MLVNNSGAKGRAVCRVHTGPLIMAGKVGVRSTHAYTIYGRRVGYRLRFVNPFEALFGTNVGVRSQPMRPSKCLSTQ